MNAPDTIRPTFGTHYFGGANIDVDALTAAVASSDWTTVIHLTGVGSGHCDVLAVWSAALTAKYGPLGTHPSRCDAEGKPTAATLEAFPCLAQAMADAAERIRECHLWRLQTPRA